MAKEDGMDTVIRFGAFEANLRSGELSKNGVKLKIGDQSFSLLAILLAQRGELVTRDDLQKQLWPTDTFVDFERGLNKAVNRLRDALGDSADSPRFIETLPKRGYRFIGTVDSPASSSLAAPIQTKTTAVQDKPLAIRTRDTILGTLALVLIASIAVWWFMRARQPSVGGGPVTRSSLLPPPHTTFVPYSFALSPSGNYLAFAAEATDGSRSLWIRTMSTASATVVAGTASASLPFWSPDERHIGFFADRKLEIVDIAREEPSTSSRTCEGGAAAPGETAVSSSSRLTSTVPSIRSPTPDGACVSFAVPDGARAVPRRCFHQEFRDYPPKAFWRGRMPNCVVCFVGLTL
jgi:DNA-binding winged helix-turn-helix (wHTH) protein